MYYTPEMEKWIDLATNRIKHELVDIRNEEDEYFRANIKIEQVNDSLRELEAEIAGPSDTPYEGAKFKLCIKIPNDYPFKAPRIRFLTKIWHPNIYSASGAICMDILKSEWTSTLCLSTTLLSIQILLATPNVDNCFDAYVANQFKNNHEMYVNTAKHWCNKYANGPYVIKEYDDKVKEFTDLGYDEHIARVVLSKEGWDVNACRAYITATFRPRP